jgi:hypothetical protein
MLNHKSARRKTGLPAAAYFVNGQELIYLNKHSNNPFS